MVAVFLVLVTVSAIAALFTALGFYLWIQKQAPGTENIQRIAGYIREGSIAYLK